MRTVHTVDRCDRCGIEDQRPGTPADMPTGWRVLEIYDHRASRDGEPDGHFDVYRVELCAGCASTMKADVQTVADLSRNRVQS